MGVRGKIEAVIYAAEEPVTLAQLSALFGEEALEELAQSAPDAPGSEAGEDEARSEQLPLPAAAPEVAEPETSAESEGADAGSDEPDGVKEAEGQPQLVMGEPYEATGEPTLVGDPDADRRAARLRDRRAREAVRAVVDALVADYAAADRGMEIREIAGGYRVATKPEYHDAVRSFVKSLRPPMKLSLQALETLAVIAYKQPVTAPEVGEIRGVDSGGVMGSLISRKLVTTAGRKQVIGRPILYKTTKEFLLRFGLKDLAELPSMEEFEKMASELEALNDEAGADAAPLLPETSAADTEPAADAGSEEPVEPRPSLEPAEPAIVVDAAEPDLPGVSVTRDGHAPADPGSVAAADGGNETPDGAATEEER
jgi:segregation and condensation protein B